MFGPGLLPCEQTCSPIIEISISAPHVEHLMAGSMLEVLIVEAILAANSLVRSSRPEPQYLRSRTCSPAGNRRSFRWFSLVSCEHQVRCCVTMPTCEHQRKRSQFQKAQMRVRAGAEVDCEGQRRSVQLFVDCRRGK